MLLRYAARHGQFGAITIPVLAKLVLLYAGPDEHRRRDPAAIARHANGQHCLVAMLIPGLAAINFVVFALARYVGRRDPWTGTLQAMAMSLPAVPFAGSSLLPAV